MATIHQAQRLNQVSGPAAAATRQRVATTEARMLCNGRSHCNEKPAHRKEEWPPLASIGESLRAAVKIQYSRKLKKDLF